MIYIARITWRMKQTHRQKAHVAITNRFFPPIRVWHPMPCHRFDATMRGKSLVRQQRTPESWS
jgi:hypothetical protein